MWRKLFCGVARFPSDGGAGFLIGGFAQKMFELRSKNTAQIPVLILELIPVFFYNRLNIKLNLSKTMARRKIESKNVRSLNKSAQGRSYAITLPIDVVRRWKWKNRQKLLLTIDEKRKRIIIEDWTRWNRNKIQPDKKKINSLMYQKTRRALPCRVLSS